MMTLSLNNRPLHDPVASGLHLRKCFGEKRLREREREREILNLNISVSSSMFNFFLPVLIIVGGDFIK